MLLEKILVQGEQRGSETAIIDDRRSVTFRQLSLAADIMAGHLDRGTGDQDKIGLLLPQSGAFAAAFLGVRWSGRIAVPLNYLLRAAELIAVCRDAGLKTIVTMRYFQELAPALRQAGYRVIFMEDVSFIAPATRLRRAAGIKRRLPPQRPADVAVIIYTSGTAGEPKGVMLTNRNLDSNAAAAIEHARFQQQLSFLGILPMFHTLGLMGCLLAPLSLGCRVVYQARFSPMAVCEVISRHQIEVLIAVPTMLAMLVRAKDAQRQALSSVRYAISGGEPLSASLTQEFHAKFGLTLLEGFGLTETSPLVSFSVPWAHRPGSVGRPLRDVQLRIVDEQERSLGPNQDGELWIKGPNVMKGYYQNPAATAAVLREDGWLKTGDLAHLDADGFLYITGRKKEMIIMAGEKIMPGEIEEVLRQYPGVLLAAVIGVKDPQRGECPVAFLQLEPELKEKPSAQEIRAFVRRQLAPYKTPRDIYFVDAMPRSATGKILKRGLQVPDWPAARSGRG